MSDVGEGSGKEVVMAAVTTGAGGAVGTGIPVSGLVQPAMEIANMRSKQHPVIHEIYGCLASMVFNKFLISQ
jgi:hypothetical protein